MRAKWLMMSGLVVLAAACSGKDSASEDIPQALAAIEGDAEHAYDVALVGDMTELATVAGTIEGAWSDFRATAADAGASETTLSQMDAAVTGLQDTAQAAPESAVAARAANAVSAPMPDLFALYSPTIPTEVLALDYLGREVVLDAMDANGAAAVADVQTIALTWEALRPAVEDAGGAQEAADFADSVARLQDLAAGSDMAALIEEANVNLELVDVLEGVF